jgi:hypothetical protein
MSQATSIREQALLAIMAALVSAGSPAENCFRSQVDSIEQASLPCFDVSPGEEKIEDPGEFGDRNGITRTLAIDVRAMVDAEDCDDSALDPFHVFAVQQLVGGTANLGGLVGSVTELGNTTIFQPHGRNIIGLEMHFELKFATKRGDPTQRG